MKRFKKSIVNFIILIISIIISYYIGHFILKTNLIPNLTFDNTNLIIDNEIGFVKLKYPITNYDKNSNNTYIKFIELSNYQENNKTKIILLGDSIIDRSLINSDNDISKMISLMLKNETIEIINLGTGGYGLDQTYLLLKKQVRKIKPTSIVLFICAFNDIDEISTNYAYMNQLEKPFLDIENDKLIITNKNILKKNNEWNIEYPLFQPISFKIRKKTYLNQTKVKHIFSKIIDNIILLSKENNITLTIVLSPDSSKNESIQKNLNIIREILNQTNYPYIDLLKKFQEKNINSDKIYQDLVHYNKKGLEIVAEIIYNETAFT